MVLTKSWCRSYFILVFGEKMEVVLDRISNYRAIIVIALPAVAVQLNLDVIGSKGFHT